MTTGGVEGSWADPEADDLRSGGLLTLLVEPAAGGVFQPFEVEFPHEGCGGAGH